MVGCFTMVFLLLRQFLNCPLSGRHLPTSRTTMGSLESDVFSRAPGCKIEFPKFLTK